MFKLNAITALSILILGLVLIPSSVQANPCGTFPSGMSYCQQLSIANQQSSAVAAGTQVMLNYNALEYNTYLASNLMNIEVYNSISGNVLYTWLVGNTLNENQNTLLSTSANILYWINLDTPIAASSTDSNIYLAYFPTTNDLFNGNNLGTAPQLYCASGCPSTSYAGVDNGQKVFPLLYQNFAGNTIPTTPTNWTDAGAPGTAFTINNGITLNPDSAMVTSASYGLNSTQIEDIYGNLQGSSTATNIYFGYTNSNNADCLGWGVGGNGVTGAPASNSIIYNFYGNTCSHSSAAFGNLNPSETTDHVFTTYWPSATSIISSFDYGPTNQIGSAYNAQVPIGAYIDAGTSVFMQWVRLRTYPPNGVQPTVTFGSIQSINAPTCTVSITNPSNAIADAGQYETFTASNTNCVSPYTYNILVVNSITPATITHHDLVTGSTSSSITYTFQIASYDVSNSPEEANVVLTDSGTNTVMSGYSTTFIVNPALVASAAPTPTSPTIYQGQSAALSISAPTTGTSPYSYQWYSGSSSTCTSDSPIPNAASLSYTASPSTNTYYCVKETDNVNEVVYTGTDLVTVLPATNFSETGLPDGVVWTVTYNSVSTNTVASNSIYFHSSLNTGSTYSFIINNSIISGVPYLPSPSSGSLQAGNALIIKFAPQNVISPSPTERVIIPLYIYPNATYSLLPNYMPGLYGVVINPDSGSGASIDTNYASAAAKLESKGVKVFGYVPTGYGADPLSYVEANIVNYYSWYHVNGIFFDEANSICTTSTENYYSSLYGYIKGNYLSNTVILNPGSQSGPCYQFYSDIINAFENPYSDYINSFYSPESWASNTLPSHFMNIIYSVPNNTVTQQTINLADNRSIGYVYITNTIGVYSILPPYFAQEANMVNPLVIKNPVASTETAANDQAISFNVIATGGSGAYTYNWFGLPPGCTPPDANSLSCIPSSPGTNTISTQVTDSYGFTNSSSQIVFDSGIIYKVPITLTNSQASNTPNPWQQPVSVNSIDYQNVENSNIINTVFFYQNGTIIDSWLEGNVLNEQQTTGLATSENSLYYLKLPSIPASSSLTVYMGFAGNTINLMNPVSTGGAPQLTTQYAQYDNGGHVFSYYQNFSGTTLSSLWQNPNSYTAIQNNGLTLTAPSGGGTFYYNINMPSSYAVDAYMKGNSLLSSQVTDLMSMGTGGSLSNYTELYLSNSLTWNLQSGSGTGGGTLLGVKNNYYVMTLSGTPSSVSSFVNYTPIGSLTGASSSVNPNIGIFTSGAGGNSYFLDWLRVRSYPPGGVTPSVTFGSLSSTAIPSISSAPSLPKTLDAGQTIAFNALATEGSGSYTAYNFLIFNSATGIQVGNYLTTSNSFAYSIPSSEVGNTLVVNVLVTDSNGESANSIFTGILTVNNPPTISITPSKTAIDAGQAITITNTVTGGTAPFTYSYTVNSMTGVTVGSNQITFADAGTFNVLESVTDNAGVTAYSANSVITVAATPSPAPSPPSSSNGGYNNNIATATISNKLNVAVVSNHNNIVHNLAFNVTVRIRSLFSNSVSMSFKNMTGNKTIPGCSSNLYSINVSITPSSTEPITIDLTIPYTFTSNKDGLVPFICTDGAWAPYTNYSISLQNHTMTLKNIPSDPIVGLLYPNYTSNATTTAVTTIPQVNTTVPTTSISVAPKTTSTIYSTVVTTILPVVQGPASENSSLFMAIAILLVIIAVSIYLIFNKMRESKRRAEPRRETKGKAEARASRANKKQKKLTSHKNDQKAKS
ncbi:MAG: spherulation-specific family 4 protein [Candidatus Micrarchaeaceae archaeon]